MGLSFDWTKCKDADKLESGLREGMIWLTMVVGMHKITETNYIQFATRVDFHQRLFGAFLQESNDKGEIHDHFVTLDEIKSCVGLSTNVTDETDAAWYKRQTEHFRKETTKKLGKIEIVPESPDDDEDGLYTIYDETFGFFVTDDDDVPLLYQTIEEAVEECREWFAQQDRTQKYSIYDVNDEVVETVERD